MNNGHAVIVDAVVHPVRKDEAIVLAVLPGNDYTPFVTWHYFEVDKSCYSGDYCRTIREAVASLDDRSYRWGVERAAV